MDFCGFFFSVLLPLVYRLLFFRIHSIKQNKTKPNRKKTAQFKKYGNETDEWSYTAKNKIYRKDSTALTLDVRHLTVAAQVMMQQHLMLQLQITFDIRAQDFS